MSGSPRARDILSGLYAGLASVVVVLQIAFAAQHEALLIRTALDPQLARALFFGAIACLVIMLAPGLVVALRQRARPRRSHGRARLLAVAMGGVANALGASGVVAVFARPEALRLLDAGLGLSTPKGFGPALYGAAAACVGGGVLTLCAGIASFGLLSATARKNIWTAIDLLLLGAVVWALTSLPSQPSGQGATALAPSVLRHALTTFGVLRLLVRAMPSLLSGIEATGFKSLVAARHLRSKKSGFLAAISMLSVLAVSLSCMALTTTLSVMGGFRNDLKRKILGSNAHIVIDVERGHIAGWVPMLHKMQGLPRIAGVAAYVNGEVMLSSASNISTAVLRGIDPQRIGTVNDLPRNLKSGSLDYLTHPEKLLALPPDVMRGTPLLMGTSRLEKLVQDTAAAADAGVADAGVADSAPPATDPTQAKLNLEKKIAALDAFLRDPDRAAQKEEEREVLPGIIIGQELARALRLYVGDEVNVVAPLGSLGPSGPIPKARPFRVAGIFYSGMYEYDMKFTYVALPAGQKFLGTGDDVSGFEVRVTDVERAPETAATIRSVLGDKGLRTRDWQELNSRLFGALALEKLAMFIALGIAILVASFCIAGTLTLMVQEKGREVAILKAMGTSDRTVVGVFVIEGGLIGLLGASLGLFLGYMLCFAAEHFGIRMNPEVYYIDRLPVHVDPTEFALAGIAAVLVCLVITIYPALLASRLRPVDALRYE